MPDHTGELDPRRLDTLLRRIRREVEHGPLPSAQVAVARGGRLLAFETYGDASPDTRYVLQSVGRSIVAGVVWKLIGEGLLAVDEQVAAIIPEFAPNEKETVTVEQVLTHTAGFPFAPLGYPKMLDREQRLAAFGRWRLDYPPGTRFQYHLTSAAWLIAEIVERRTGLTFADYLHEKVAGPLGLSSIELGVPVDRQPGTVAPMLVTDRTSDDQEADPGAPGTCPTRACSRPASPATPWSPPPPMSRCTSRRWSTRGCGSRARSRRAPGSGSRSTRTANRSTAVVVNGAPAWGCS